MQSTECSGCVRGRVGVLVWGGVGAVAGLLLLSLGGCAKGAPRSGGQQPTSVLSAFSPTTPTEAAAWAVDPYDADKRYRGILLLANAPFGGEPVYVDLYVRAASDEDSGVRTAGVRGLALHGSPEHVPLIAGQLESEDRVLRWECARALQRLHNDEAVAPLMKRLEERIEAEPLVRAASADALGQYAEPKVVDALVASLADRDLNVHNAARKSLRTLTGQDFGPDLRSWVAWRKQSPDLFAARQTYVYPVFQRDRNLGELLAPMFFRPPNETASTPVGFDPARASAAAESAAPAAKPDAGAGNGGGAGAPPQGN